MSDVGVWTYVIAAYGVAWVGMIGYGIRLFVANRRARRLYEDAGGVE